MEMLALKYIGVGLLSIAMAGAAIAIGNILDHSLTASQETHRQRQRLKNISILPLV